jgi:ferredoxin
MVKKVFITPGCISCGACESICPEVFKINGTAQIRPDANIEKNIALIKEAADICPVQVIKIEK